MPQRQGDTTARNSAPSTSGGRTSNQRTNGFYDAPVRALLGGKPVHLSVCGRCGSFVPGGSEAAKAQQLHRAFHEQIDGPDQRR
jgi:hypothetical protein